MTVMVIIMQSGYRYSLHRTVLDLGNDHGSVGAL